MKAPAAREGKDRPHDLASRRGHGVERPLQILGIDDRQWLRFLRRRAVEAAVQPFREGGVGRSVVGEAPAERRGIEGLDARECAVARLQFQIVELAVGLHLYIP